MSALQIPPTPWGVNDDGDVADEGGELVAINPRTGAFPAALLAASPELYDSIDVPNLRKAAELLTAAGSTLWGGLLTVMADKQECALAKARGQ